MNAVVAASIVIALLIGVGIGYTIAKPQAGEAPIETTTIYTTVTSERTVTETSVMIETKTSFKTVTNTVTEIETVTKTLNPMPPLEELQKGVILRLKVGSAAAELLANAGVKKLAVLAQSNLYCIELGSVISAVFEKSGQGEAQLFIIQPGVNEANTTSAITGNGFNAALLAYGGNSPREEVVEGFKSVVNALRDAGYSGTIIVHAAAFTAKAVDEALKDNQLCGYLKSVEVYVYLPKPDEGVVYLFKANIAEDCSINLVKVAETPLG